MKPKICVTRTDGTNCDRETKEVFNLVGGDAEIVHINTLIKKYDPVDGKKKALKDYDILGIPGGFSHGDYIKAGKVFANDLKHFLGDEVLEFVESGKPVIGICNGFQVLVNYGLLPGINIKGNKTFEQTTTLTYNNSNKFEDRWVHLIKPYVLDAHKKCIWTKDIENIDLPVAHGEGKFVADAALIDRLYQNNQIVFQYCDDEGVPTRKYPLNPNGSISAIAGICDDSGLIFGLMPHPERYNTPMNHHLSTLQKVLSKKYVDKSEASVECLVNEVGILPKKAPGLKIFKNAVDYVNERLETKEAHKRGF